MSSRITTSLLAAAVAAAAITPATAHAYRTYADDPEVRYPARWYSSSVEWELSTAGLEASGLTHFAFQVTDRPVEQMRYFAETVMNRYA